MKLSISVLPILIAVFFYSNLFAQTQVTEGDKNYIAETIDWLNKPYEDFNNEIKDDPIMKEDISGYMNGKVYYLPGSEYKLFFFDGKDCLDKCTPITYATIMNKEGISEEPYEIELSSIKSVNRIGDEIKYLIIQKSNFSSGVEATECASASVLTFENGTPVFSACFIEGKDEYSNSNPMVNAFACSSTFVKKETFMTYDAERNKLLFRYQTYNDMDFVREGKYMDIYGEYSYRDGYFKLDYQEVKDEILGG